MPCSSTVVVASGTSTAIVSIKRHRDGSAAATTATTSATTTATKTITRAIIAVVRHRDGSATATSTTTTAASASTKTVKIVARAVVVVVVVGYREGSRAKCVVRTGSEGVVLLLEVPPSFNETFVQFFVLFTENFGKTVNLLLENGMQFLVLFTVDSLQFGKFLFIDTISAVAITSNRVVRVFIVTSVAVFPRC